MAVREPDESAAWHDVAGVRDARRHAIEQARALGFDWLTDRVAIVTSELATNAVLHGGGCTGVWVEPVAGGVRICVGDNSRSLPLLGRPSEHAMTGRGLDLVGRLTTDLGVEPTETGKFVWADVTGDAAGTALRADALTDGWDHDEPAEGRHRVELGEVPTEFLLAAKAHVDNLAREFTLIATGAASGTTEAPPAHLEQLLSVITERFGEARLAIKEQALRAAHQGKPRTNLVLQLSPAAAEAGEEYLRALDELDDYCRANRLFTFETEPEHRVFRQWYVGEIVSQLRAAASGSRASQGKTFEQQLLDELREFAHAHETAERAARLYELARALAVSATPESVASAVLNEGVAALRADAGGLLLARREDPRLALPGAIGYDEAVLSRLREESRDADLPAAVALRTGEPVWLETRAERDHRFPEVASLEPSMEALCAVPLAVGDRRLGALRFSFKRPRLFDEGERRFILALADQTAQALDRAQLQHDRIEISRRLQRSLLPPDLPMIPSIELAAVYHPFGAGADVGGDFYDAWELRDGQWAIAIGDSAGTGPEAAGLTALVRHSLRALSLSERRPAHVLGQLNRLLTASIADGERFCTAVFGVVTVGDGIVVELASGGHPEPVLRHADGRLEPSPCTGSLLGPLPDAPIERWVVTLEPGSTLVLFTDGVIEARSPDGVFFDFEGVERVLEAPPTSAASVAKTIEDRVLEHCGGACQDDMAIVVLHVPAS